MFADCRNYTAMTQALGPERIAPVMDSFFRTAYDVVVKYDGIVDKFMGDAVMALFNVPILQRDHVTRAVGAAIELQRAVERLNTGRPQEIRLYVGIGMSTGYALTGRIGSSNPSDYTAIGEVVNLASRLQSEAKPGEILVTQDVYLAVAGAFPQAGRREFNLKGVSGLVPAYLLA